MKIKVVPVFSRREQRTEWGYKNYKEIFLNSKVLDVGCYEAPLRNIVGKESYTGVDFVGDPDVKINLEDISVLPFADGDFETVICVEVLEHLDNIHNLAKDLFRLSRKNVLISLPNAWRDARVKVERGRGEIAHYGLPLVRPYDRHKWFFNAEDAASFLGDIAPDGWSCELITTEPERSKVVMKLRRFRYSEWSYINRYCQTVWAKYEFSLNE